jgi:hypothetical protein
MAEQGLFLITDTSAMHALAKYAAKESLRGKGMLDTARKVFAFLVSFALAKIPNGDPRAIRANLMRVTTAYSRLRSASVGVSSNIRSRKTRRNRTADALRGTLAAKLVWLLNYAGARAARGPAFYKLVRKFVSGRVYSERLHRAGLLPALSGTRARSKGGRLPKFRHTPGSYAESLTEDVSKILAENWASAHGPDAKGIIGLAGFAFDTALPEVDRLLSNYLQKDIEKAAREAGFQVPAAS